MIPMEIHMAAIKQRADKVDRHRQRMLAAGFRPVQFWVPDTRGADLAERVRQKCLKLKGDQAEREALRLLEEAAAQVVVHHITDAIVSRFSCNVNTTILALPSMCRPIFCSQW